MKRQRHEQHGACRSEDQAARPRDNSDGCLEAFSNWRLQEHYSSFFSCSRTTSAVKRKVFAVAHHVGLSLLAEDVAQKLLRLRVHCRAGLDARIEILLV